MIPISDELRTSEQVKSEVKIEDHQTTSPASVDLKYTQLDTINQTIVPSHLPDFNQHHTENGSLFTPIDIYQNHHFYTSTLSGSNSNSYHSVGELANWPCDLSRTSRDLRAGATSSYDHNNYPASAAQYSNSVNSSVAGENLCLRSPFAMKGNLMAICPSTTTIDFMPSPSSTSSGSSYLSGNDNNNNDPYIDSIYHLNSIEDVFCDTLKTENCYLVEDTSANAQYHALSNAAATGEIYHLHDYSRDYATNNHSTASSGGDSRSPDGYTNDDYDTGMQAQLTQLTNLTTRTNGMYQSSPVTGAEHHLIYDSGLTPTR